MVLGGTGDAMGFNNGNWEFNKYGPDIHRQVGCGGSHYVLVHASQRFSCRTAILLQDSVSSPDLCLTYKTAVSAQYSIKAPHYTRVQQRSEVRGQGSRGHKCVCDVMTMQGGARFWDHIIHDGTEASAILTMTASC